MEEMPEPFGGPVAGSHLTQYGMLIRLLIHKQGIKIGPALFHCMYGKSADHGPDPWVNKPLRCSWYPEEPYIGTSERHALGQTRRNLFNNGLSHWAVPEDMRRRVYECHRTAAV